MANVTLKAILRPKSEAFRTVAGLLGDTASIADVSGTTLLGEAAARAGQAPVDHEGVTLGWVSAERPETATALASLLTHLAAKEAERRALANEVLFLYREVNLIERLSEQLAALPDLSEIGQFALAEARRLIAASQGTVLALDPEDGSLHCVASFGNQDGDDPGELSPAARHAAEREVAEIINGADASILCAPLRAKQRTVGVIALANTADAPYFTTDLKLLNTIALQTAAAIENSFLTAEMVDAVRNREQLAALQKELDTARTIQHSLIPNTFPPFPERREFDLYAKMIAAQAVGGDFYDFFLLDERRLGMVIGDVSGKGIPAALFMAMTVTRIRTIASEGGGADHCLTEVNRVLVREKASNMFATCFYGILDLVSGRLEYCRAGHNPPYLARTDGTVETLDAAGGLPLGMFRKVNYSTATARMAAGDTILLFTDGITEAMNPRLEQYGEERLIELLGARTAALGAEALVKAVTQSATAFAEGAQASDDMTALGVRLSADE